MKDAWLEHWDNKYRGDEYAFGTAPNNYFQETLLNLPVGKILFPAEGEGRNAVYAAKLGWKVWAFDISTEGKTKAQRLAMDSHVMIDYQLGELPDLDYRADQFDAIALIYAHFPATIKSKYHRMLDRYLRPGGMIIFEAFSKKHIHYRSRNDKVGGPRDLESLFSIDELKSDFENYDIIELVEREIELSEGQYHNGIGSVIRFIGRKRSS